MKTLTKRINISVAVFALLAIIFVVFIVAASGPIAYASSPVEVGGVITYKVLAGSTIRYNAKSQALLDGFTATYTVEANNYDLVHNSNFVYEEGSVWEFKTTSEEEYVALDLLANNFVLAGTYRRNVTVYDRSDFKPKPGQATFLEYTIDLCDPTITPALQYTAVIGMKLTDIVLPLGWSKAESVTDQEYDIVETITGIDIVFEAPAGTETNFDLDPIPAPKTITVEVLLKPVVVFKGKGEEQKTLSPDAITYDSETNRYSANIIDDHKFIKTGYKFRSFKIQDDGSEIEYASEIDDPGGTMNRTFDLAPVPKVVFIAQWNPKEDTKYKVEHYRQGLTDPLSYQKKDIDTQTHEGTTDSVVTIDFADPEEARIWKMEGFSLDPVKSQESDNYSGKIKPDGTLTLKLYYSRDTYKIQYSKGDDELITGEPPANSNEYKYEERINLQTGAGLVKAGYTFAGWTDGKTKAGSDLKVFSVSLKYTMIAPTDELGDKIDTLTFTAKFIPNSNTHYTVKHILAADDSVLKEQLLSGQTDSEVTAIALVPGYKKLAGYAASNGKEYLEKGIVAADESLVLAIYYEIVDYTVTFNLGSTELLAPETYNINGLLTLPEAPPKEGYLFDSWKINGVTYMPGDKISILGSVRVDAVYFSTAETPTTGGDVANNNIFTVRPPDGLSGGAIAGIVIASTVVLAATIFSIIWFGVKKKSFKDMKFKKKKIKRVL